MNALRGILSNHLSRHCALLNRVSRESERAGIDPDIPAPYPQIGTAVRLHVPITLGNGIETHADRYTCYAYYGLTICPKRLRVEVQV